MFRGKSVINIFPSCATVKQCPLYRKPPNFFGCIFFTTNAWHISSFPRIHIVLLELGWYQVFFLVEKNGDFMRVSSILNTQNFDISFSNAIFYDKLYKFEIHIHTFPFECLHFFVNCNFLNFTTCLQFVTQIWTTFVFCTLSSKNLCCLRVLVFALHFGCSVFISYKYARLLSNFEIHHNAHQHVEHVIYVESYRSWIVVFCFVSIFLLENSGFCVLNTYAIIVHIFLEHISMHVLKCMYWFVWENPAISETIFQKSDKRCIHSFACHDEIYQLCAQFCTPWRHETESQKKSVFLINVK